MKKTGTQETLPWRTNPDERVFMVLLRCNFVKSRLFESLQEWTFLFLHSFLLFGKLSFFPFLSPSTQQLTGSKRNSRLRRRRRRRRMKSRDLEQKSQGRREEEGRSKTSRTWDDRDPGTSSCLSLSLPGEKQGRRTRITSVVYFCFSFFVQTVKLSYWLTQQQQVE